jgi:hypothetical protein
VQLCDEWTPIKVVSYLIDGIYPQWSTFANTISKPQVKKTSLFTTTREYEEGCGRAFGVLQARWGIVRHPSRM